MCCLIVKYDAPAFLEFFPLCQLRSGSEFDMKHHILHVLGTSIEFIKKIL